MYVKCTYSDICKEIIISSISFCTSVVYLLTLLGTKLRKRSQVVAFSLVCVG